MERAVAFACEHWGFVTHFDKAHFDQGPQVIRADRRKFCSLGFNIAQSPAEMDRLIET